MSVSITSDIHKVISNYFKVIRVILAESKPMTFNQVMRALEDLSTIVYCHNTSFESLRPLGAVHVVGRCPDPRLKLVWHSLEQGISHRNKGQALYLSFRAIYDIVQFAPHWIPEWVRRLPDAPEWAKK